MNESSFVLPLFDPRPYQVPLWQYMQSGGKRAFIVWHRRAGKEVCCWNYVIAAAFQRVGTYTYFFPTASLGKKVLWDGANKTGMRFLDYIPRDLVKRTNSQEMVIELVNDSIIRIAGTDKILNVGTNPVGCVFSEFSLQNPRSWNYIRPILAENEGWAIFNSTPRGRNHAYDLYQMAIKNKDWFCQLLSVDDTHAIDAKAIDDERKAGMSEDLILQEFYCSFECGVQGAIFGRQMHQAHEEKRIGHVPYDANLLVYTAWDIGIGDSTAIVFFQLEGDSVRVIDCYENAGYPLNHYINHLKTRPWAAGYGGHIVPHDAQHKNQVTGHTYTMAARELGVDMTALPLDYTVESSIEVTRGLFTKIFIDEVKCDYLVKCLLQYHYEYDENARRYKDRPCHDWSSHTCDAVRYMSLAIKNGHVGKRIGANWQRLKEEKNYYDNSTPNRFQTPSQGQIW